MAAPRQDTTDDKERFTGILADFIRLTAICLPDDVEEALRHLAEREEDSRAKALYKSMTDNVALAGKLQRPVCQDTGVLQFFVECGYDFPYRHLIKDVLVDASVLATARTPLRPNAVEPLSEHNTGTNTGFGAPYITWEMREGRDCNIRIYMAGGGCSLPGGSKVLMPLEGIQGIRDFVAETVLERGINACPPLIVGVGLGTCAVTSAELSKKALLRPIGSTASLPAARELEAQLKKDLNRIGIAPLGFGGSESVLAVHVEACAHHPATLGVGISTGCWATRRGEIIFAEDLSYDIRSHAQYDKYMRLLTGEDPE